jgi:hypothetical protein
LLGEHEGTSQSIEIDKSGQDEDDHHHS